MSGAAFLLMVAGFAVVFGWYVWNHERDSDGRTGVLAIRTDEEKAVSDAGGPRPPERGAAVRSGDEGLPALARVRRRAVAARAAAKPSGRRAGPEDRRSDPD